MVCYHPESAEEADHNEALELDDEQYPILPEDLLEYGLHRRKAVLRQYMAATRCMFYSDLFYIAMYNKNDSGFYKLNGRIPWTDIADRPSDHLSNGSRPDTDFKLEEPSHMKSDGVDCWLKHWLKSQKKGRHPLVLRDPTRQLSQAGLNPKVVSKRKAKRSKALNMEINDADDREPADALQEEEDVSAGDTLATTSDRPGPLMKVSKGKGKVANDRNGGLDGINRQDRVATLDKAGHDMEIPAPTSHHIATGLGEIYDSLEWTDIADQVGMESAAPVATSHHTMNSTGGDSETPALPECPLSASANDTTR